MSSVQILALLIGIGGFLVVVYFTTELAALYFGPGRLPAPLLPLAARVGTENRFGRAVFLVLFLTVLEVVVVAVLVSRRAELDPLSEALFASELVAAILWIGWLSARYRGAKRIPGR